MSPAEVVRRLEGGDYTLFHALFHQDGGWPVFKTFKRLMREHPSPQVRYEAVYALQAHSLKRAAVETLLDAAEDRSEYPEIRGQALETLAGALLYQGPRRHRVVRRVLALLKDPQAEVRFWAIYALWHMRARVALPALERMTEDPSRPRLYWTVGQEARDAIAALRDGQAPPERPIDPEYVPFSWERE